MDKKPKNQISTTAPGPTLGINCHVAPFVFVGDNVKIGNTVKIHSRCYIGHNVTIGDDCILYPGVVIYDGCFIGKSCIIYPNTVVGCDGFYITAEESDEKRLKAGNVIIEDHVEIGSGTCIDRALIGSTVIRKGSRIDNYVMIAHNVDVGENCILSAGSFIGASTRLGRNVILGAQAGIIGNLDVVDNIEILRKPDTGNGLDTEGLIVHNSLAFAVAAYQRDYELFISSHHVRQRHAL